MAPQKKLNYINLYIKGLFMNRLVVLESPNLDMKERLPSEEINPHSASKTTARTIS